MAEHDHDEHVDPNQFMPALWTVSVAAIVAIALVIALTPLPSIAG